MEGNLLPTVFVLQVLNIFQELRAICISRSFFQQDNCHLEGLRTRLLRLPSKPQLEGRGKTGHLEFGMQTHLSFKLVQCVNFYTNLENTVWASTNELIISYGPQGLEKTFLYMWFVWSAVFTRPL